MIRVLLFLALIIAVAYFIGKHFIIPMYRQWRNDNELLAEGAEDVDDEIAQRRTARKKAKKTSKK